MTIHSGSIVVFTMTDRMVLWHPIRSASVKIGGLSHVLDVNDCSMEESYSGNANTVVIPVEQEISTNGSKKKPPSLETQLQHYLEDRAYQPNSEKLLHEVMPHLKILGFQIPLYCPERILTRNSTQKLTFADGRTTAVIGKIDVLFQHKSRVYVGEIKDYNPMADSFWYASKALAYCEYYKWQTDKKGYHPAVIIPKESIRLEHQIVAGKLGIRIFLFKKDINGKFLMKAVDNRPHWKQEPF